MFRPHFCDDCTASHFINAGTSSLRNNYASLSRFWSLRPLRPLPVLLSFWRTIVAAVGSLPRHVAWIVMKRSGLFITWLFLIWVLIIVVHGILLQADETTVAAATFWTWLWGPIGLILATPLTMCLVVLGRHVDRARILEVMFGDEPPLTPAELVYQRMLARDPVEAADQARIFLKDKPLTAYYDEILLEGLRLAQADAQRGSLDEDQTRRIRDAVAELVDDLATHTGVDEPRTGPAEEDFPLAQLEKAEAKVEEQELPERWRRATCAVHTWTQSSFR